MKQLITRLSVSAVLTIGVVGLTIAGSGVAGAKTSHRAGAAPAKAAGVWSYVITDGRGKKNWRVYFVQAGGFLSGSATGSCASSATILGSVTGKRVTETWKCGTETIKLKGSIAGNKITGTTMDSQYGSGTFVAKKGQLDDDGGSGDGGGDGGSGGGDGGSGGGDR